MKAIVLGGYGAVGTEVVAELRASGDDCLVAGRDPARADRMVDLQEPGAAAYRAAVAGVDVVINTSGVENPALAALAAVEGAAFVDISATSEYVAALERLKPQRPVVVSVGLAPGLTNLLAAALHDAEPGPIDIALVLGAGERHGAAATAWSYGLLGMRFREPDGRAVRNYTRPRAFDLPGYGRRRLYRTDFADQHALTRDIGVPVRTYFGLDSRLATSLLAGLTWIPGASRAPRSLHLPGTDRWLALAQSTSATRRWAAGRGQSHATAVMTAVAARATARLPAGVQHLHSVLTLAEVPAGRGIELS